MSDGQRFEWRVAWAWDKKDSPFHHNFDDEPRARALLVEVRAAVAHVVPRRRYRPRLERRPVGEWEEVEGEEGD